MFSPRFDLYLHYHVLIVCSCILIYVMKWEGLIVFSLKIICIDYNVTKQIMCSQLNICLVLTVSALSECVQTICDISKEQSSFNFCFFFCFVYLTLHRKTGQCSTQDDWVCLCVDRNTNYWFEWLITGIKHVQSTVPNR